MARLEWERHEPQSTEIRTCWTETWMFRGPPLTTASAHRHRVLACMIKSKRKQIIGTTLSLPRSVADPTERHNKSQGQVPTKRSAVVRTSGSRTFSNIFGFPMSGLRSPQLLVYFSQGVGGGEKGWRRGRPPTDRSELQRLKTRLRRSDGHGISACLQYEN